MRATTDRHYRKWRLAQWLELRWWRRYLQQRDITTYLAAKRDYWQRILALADLQPRAGSRALDAGCGPAGIFLILPQLRVEAVDPLLKQYARQLPHFRPADYPWVDFRTQPLEAGLPAAQYDELYCLNAINHVADWSAALDVLTQAARPGARLLLGIDVHRYRWLRWVFRRLPGDLLHPQQHDRTDYREALHHRGWRIEREVTAREGRIFDYWLIRATLTGPSFAESAKPRAVK